MHGVGRTAEQRALDAALRPPGGRVALVGPGGAGKTHLARGLPDARFCDLTGCRTGQDVLARTAEACGVLLCGPDDPTRLGDALAGHTVVFDGCEPVLHHVLALANGWDTRVRCVLTTRVRPPGVPVIEVGPLSLPRGDTLEHVQASDAGALFLQAAREAVPGWDPDPAEGPALAELLRRLDGLPLAIRLAAARLRVVGTRELLALLSERFRLLRGDEGSVEAVIQASWDLLSDRERDLLARLAWFGGGFDLEAVAAACEGSALDGVERLQELIDHSLLRTWELERLPGVRWAALYDSVRAFARSRATPPSQAAWLARRGHALAEALRGPSWQDAMERLSVFGPDLRRAFDEAEAVDVPTAERAALALDGLLKRRGPADARGPLLQRAAALGGPFADNLTLTRIEAGDLAPDPDALEALADRSTGRREAWACWTAARELAVRGATSRARILAERAARVAPAEPRALSTLAEVQALAGDRGGAVAIYHQALAAAHHHATPRDEAAVQALLAMVLLDLGRHDEALEGVRRAIALLDGLGDARAAAIWAQLVGDIALEQERADDADRAYAEADRRLAAVGEPRWRAGCAGGRAMARALAGDLAGARTALRDALREARLHHQPRVQGFLACWAATLDAEADLPDEASHRLDDAALTLPQVADGVWVARRGIDLARARSLRARGDEVAATALQVQVQGLLAEVDRARWTSEVRVAARRVDRAAAAMAPARVDATLARDGSWFELPGADRVSLATRHNNRRVLERLIEAHASGAPAAVADLLAAGWPGERVVAEAGAARVYTAVATLRRAGLREVIERTEIGYQIRPDALVRVVPP